MNLCPRPPNFPLRQNSGSELNFYLFFISVNLIYLCRAFRIEKLHDFIMAYQAFGRCLLFVTIKCRVFCFCFLEQSLKC